MVTTAHRLGLAAAVFWLALSFSLCEAPARGDVAPKQALSAYILAAMNTWVPPEKQPEPLDETRARYASIADDIAAAVERDDEPSLFPNDPDKTLTGLLVASMAVSESTYFKRVDEGHCLQGECDGGLAFTMWQIHPQCGLAFYDLKWRFDCAHGFRGVDLVTDRQLAVRLVLHIIRGPHDGRWNGGERLSRAQGYAATHPR
jgi:hypothetical protein